MLAAALNKTPQTPNTPEAQHKKELAKAILNQLNVIKQKEETQQANRHSFAPAASLAGKIVTLTDMRLDDIEVGVEILFGSNKKTLLEDDRAQTEDLPKEFQTLIEKVIDPITEAFDAGDISEGDELHDMQIEAIEKVKRETIVINGARAQLAGLPPSTVKKGLETITNIIDDSLDQNNPHASSQVQEVVKGFNVCLEDMKEAKEWVLGIMQERHVPNMLSNAPTIA